MLLEKKKKHDAHWPIAMRRVCINITHRTAAVAAAAAAAADSYSSNSSDQVPGTRSSAPNIYCQDRHRHVVEAASTPEAAEWYPSHPRRL